MIGRRTNPVASVLLHAGLGAAALVTIVPFVWLITSSLKSNADFFTSVFFPAGEGVLGIDWGRVTLANYKRIFLEENFIRPLVVSVFLSTVTAMLATVCCAMGGFALAHYRFVGKRVCLAIVLAVLVIPPPLLLAPTYQLLYDLGLLDNYAGLILPAMAPAFGVFLFRQASLASVPAQLIEAARIDGCSEGRIFFQIALPLVRPMVGAFLLITFLAVWNNFVQPQIVLQSAEKFPLSVAVAQLRDKYYQDYGLLMAATLVSILPVMLLFMLMQREFISGLTAGAVKG